MTNETNNEVPEYSIQKYEIGGDYTKEELEQFAVHGKVQWDTIRRQSEYISYMFKDNKIYRGQDLTDDEFTNIIENYGVYLTDAIRIHEHWATFNKHLEENPSLKEDWDNLCMAIKLSEE